MSVQREVNEKIIRHCSPTLAGLKTGSLFGQYFENREILFREVRRLNAILFPKGLRVLPLQYQNQRALIYLYRPAKLKQDFNRCEVCRILHQHGYQHEDIAGCLTKLKQKLQTEKEFPHEIGLFLGYPPEDVAGFIRHEPCKCTGCWKVYGDELKALALFDKFQKCTDIFLHDYKNGCSLEQLAVSV